MAAIAVMDQICDRSISIFVCDTHAYMRAKFGALIKKCTMFANLPHNYN